MLEECGIGSHDIYSRFRHFTGHGIKGFIVHHRIELAKRLLMLQDLSVGQVAFAVGYSTPNGFSTTFKRRIGLGPTAYRGAKERWKESYKEE